MPSMPAFFNDLSPAKRFLLQALVLFVSVFLLTVSISHWLSLNAGPPAQDQHLSSSVSTDTVFMCSANPNAGQWANLPVNLNQPHFLVDGDEGIYEVNRFEGQAINTAQQKAAVHLVDQVRDTVGQRGWHNFDQAIRDGFSWYLPGHYAKKEYLYDEQIMDPERPEVLIYSGKRLIGAMFLATCESCDIDLSGPQPGGALTQWHYHIFNFNFCFPDRLPEKEFGLALPGSDGVCPSGVLTNRTPEMIHVWLEDHPEGRFASDDGFSLPPVNQACAGEDTGTYPCNISVRDQPGLVR